MLAAAIVGTTIIALPVFALSPGTFEGSDGNLVANGGKDWTATDINRQIKSDKLTGSGDDSFGEGTKEDDAVPTVTDGAIPNNKSDLTNFYVGSESVESPTGTFNDFLYLGWSRVQDPSGTTNLDFELNQSNTLSTNSITYVRTPGDVLIKYDLSNGGTKPTLGIQRWTTTGANSQCEAAGGKIPCWNKSVALTAPAAQAGLNATPVLDPFADPAKNFDPRTFGEAAINLQAAGIFTGPCVNFGHAYVKSRSADSFTAAVKDFIAPVNIGLNSCPPATVKLKKVTTGSNATNLAGASFELYRDADTSGTINAGDLKIAPTSPPDPCVTTADDGIGNCVFSVSVTGTFLARETVAPPGYTLDPTVQVFMVTVGRNAAVITRTFSDSPQPGTIRVTKDDGAGLKLAGATFELYAGNTATGTVLATQTTDGDPLGIVEFTGLAPGTYTVKETVAPPGYDLPAVTTQTTTIAIAAGGDLKFITFSDSPTPGSITVIKRDVDTGLPIDTATFKLWRDLGTIGVLEKQTDVALDTCQTTMGTCTFSNLPVGKYIVEETAAPSGYDLPSPAFQAVSIDVDVAGPDNDLAGDQETLTFNDRITPGRITITKTDDDDPALKLGGAQFALFLDNGDGFSGAGDTAAGTCTTSLADDATLGTCSFTGLNPGVYFVVETQAPSGYDLPTLAADRIKKVTIDKVDGGDTEGVSFSDPRRFTVITVVCQERGKKLYPSEVMFDGVTKLSAAAGDLAAGTTEAEVCDLTKARFEGRHFGGPTAGSVTIPK